ncbi:AbiJ-NTD4 domain-containing protein [Microbacterium stercoris]|uniref:HEPN AbiJ-N-terminal domain-containing protein n=1 Tax=Microbacterium stercoris TaxID=2820289 RepID=A0A939TS34_9MICO|nr:hypothetical protein [Microbacterium stercoris]MBO3664786.1 hypothetical protein [Microbacterium stercoris]
MALFSRRRYSERTGLRPPARLERQFRELDERTRTAVWNVIHGALQQLGNASLINEVADDLYTSHYGGMLGISEPREYRTDAILNLQTDITRGEWPEVADALEAFYDAMRPAESYRPDQWSSSRFMLPQLVATFENDINATFAHHQVDHRMRNGAIIDIRGEAEAGAIDLALTPGGPFTAAQAHIEAALGALSNRRSPKPLEAIREAVHAAESAARVVTGEATLAEALKTLQRRNDLHPALARGWQALYGWSSDAGGVRHGDTTITEASVPLARWLVVSAAAFVSYLQAEHAPQA